MRKLLNLSKTLLVAAGLCVGASNAWAEAETVYSQNFTTDTSSGTSTTPADYAGITAGSTGGTNSATITSGVFTSSVGAGTSSDNYNTYTASFTEVTGDYEVTFTCTWSPGSATGNGLSRLTIMDGSDNAVLTLQKGQGSSTNYQFLVNGTVVKGLGSGNNSDTYNVSATINLKSKKITALSVGTMYTLSEAIDFHSSSATGVAKLEIYHKNKANWTNTTTLDDILFQKEAITASYADVTFTYVDTDNNSLTAYKADQVVNAEVGTTIASLITSTYTADFYNGTTKYEYADEYAVTGDYTTVQEAGNTVTLKFREKTAVTSVTVNYKYNDAVIASEAQSNISGLYVGETATIPYRMYVKVDDALYKTTAQGSNPYYGVSGVTLTANTVVERTLTAVDLDGGTIEMFADLDDTDGQNAGIRASYCSAYDNKAYTSTETLPIGIYKFIFRAQNKGRGSSIKVGDIAICTAAEIGNSGTWTDKEFTNVAIYAPAQLTIAAGGSGTRDDYDIIIAIRTGDITVSKTITAAGWATYCSPYALDFTNSIDNLTAAYLVTGGANGKVTLSAPINTTVPANTGLLLKGSGECVIPIVASSTTDVSSNKLQGVTADTEKDAETIYVLMNDATNGVGFYKNTNAFTVGANTAYLNVSDLPAPSSTRTFYSISSDEASGIRSIENTVINGQDVYNLSGQRISKPTKGLFIVNGKKVIK